MPKNRYRKGGFSSRFGEDYMQPIPQLDSLRSIERSLRDTIGAYSVESTSLKEPKLLMHVTRAAQYTIIHTELSAIRLKHGQNDLMKGWRGQAFIIWQNLGRIEVNEGGHRYVTQKDSLVLIDPTMENTFGSDGDAGFVAMAIPDYQLARLRKGKSRVFASPIDGSAGLGRIVSGMFRDIVVYGNQLTLREMEIATSSLISLLGSALCERQTKVNSQSGLLEHMAAWVIEHVSDQNISPCTLAEVFNLSRRSLYRIFAANDLKPDAWLWTLRIEEAARQLRETSCQDCSITELAFRTGFNDISHFSRLFRQTYGTTPSRYRRRF